MSKKSRIMIHVSAEFFLDVFWGRSLSASYILMVFGPLNKLDYYSFYSVVRAL